MNDIKLPKKYFTIYEDKWIHGGNAINPEIVGFSLLLNLKGFSCCVGHCLRDAGVPTGNMLNAAYASHYCVLNLTPQMSDWHDKFKTVFYSEKGNHYSIYTVNDYRNFTMPKRKKLLRVGFKQLFGLNIRFVKKSPPEKKAA